MHLHYFFFQVRHVFIAARRQMEHAECYRAVGRIKAEQSITVFVLFFGYHHSVISQLCKQFQASQTVVRRLVASRQMVTISEDRYIAVRASGWVGW